MRYLITVLLALFIFSCTRKNDLPPGILQPGKMQEVFWDYIRADVYTNNFMNHDSLLIPSGDWHVAYLTPDPLAPEGKSLLLMVRLQLAPQ